MTRLPLVAVCIGLAAAGVRAQGPPTFAVPPPPAGAVTIVRDVQYGAAGSLRLMMDVYRPPTTAVARPTLIFFNTAAGADRGNAFYAGWAQTAASRGLVAIVPDLRAGTQADDYHALVRHLSEHAGDYGIDAAALAVYAGSGNVSTAFPIIEDPADRFVKAAVMYYGTGNVKDFRLDLPVLYVRAGLDRPPVNRAIGELAALAVSQNAPLTLLNHATGHHAFEIADPDDATREVIEATIDFVKRATSAPYQTALRRALPEAMAAAAVSKGNYTEAVKQYAPLAAARPDDARLHLAYGEALLGDRQYANACAELEKLKNKGLGYRDLGLPAARACMLNGDGDAAIAWLRSIPQRFLPVEIETDPVFEPLRGREDFRALFKR
jgi:dienelactone hydrolase